MACKSSQGIRLRRFISLVSDAGRAPLFALRLAATLLPLTEREPQFDPLFHLLPTWGNQRLTSQRQTTCDLRFRFATISTATNYRPYRPPRLKGLRPLAQTQGEPRGSHCGQPPHSHQRPSGSRKPTHQTTTHNQRGATRGSRRFRHGSLYPH